MTTTATPPTAQEPPKGGDAAHHSHALADDTMERNDEGSRRWPSITDASASSRTPTAPSHCVVGDVVTPNMLSASKGWLRYVAHSCGDDEVDTAINRACARTVPVLPEGYREVVGEHH